MPTGHATSEALRFSTRRGLDLPISGAPEQSIHDGPPIQTVALLGDDYIGMKPTMAVQPGDRVQTGQMLFDDKKNPGVVYTSPASGQVTAVNRGEKRKFESIEIEVDSQSDEEQTFDRYEDYYLHNLEADKVKANLLRSGLWTCLRQRPFGRVPAPASKPHSIFITAIDTNPLAADPAVVLQHADYQRWFTAGIQALSTLTEGRCYLCKRTGATIPGEDEECVQTAEFDGPHPSGLVGTHIHFLDPVSASKTVWYVNYQDAVAVGRLFLTGRLHTERVISVAGPVAESPRLVTTRLGARVANVVGDAVAEDTDIRVISGSVLAGRRAVPPVDYLGRYDLQISLLAEGRQRDLLGWAMPGLAKFSVTRAFAAAFTGLPATLPFNTSTQGSVRAIVPVASYDKVMPLDILPIPLLKSLCVNDVETAEVLGCLELEEEDLALCTFVCPGKNNYGPLLRRCLTDIEREG